MTNTATDTRITVETEIRTKNDILHERDKEKIEKKLKEINIEAMAKYEGIPEEDIKRSFRRNFLDPTREKRLTQEQKIRIRECQGFFDLWMTEVEKCCLKNDKETSKAYRDKIQIYIKENFLKFPQNLIGPTLTFREKMRLSITNPIGDGDHDMAIKFISKLYPKLK